MIRESWLAGSPTPESNPHGKSLNSQFFLDVALVFAQADQAVASGHPELDDCHSFVAECLGSTGGVVSAPSISLAGPRHSGLIALSRNPSAIAGESCEVPAFGTAQATRRRGSYGRSMSSGTCPIELGNEVRLVCWWVERILTVYRASVQ